MIRRSGLTVLLVTVIGMAAVGCSGSDDPGALKIALAELASVPPVDGAVLVGVSADGCLRDDWDGDAEPSGAADFHDATEMTAEGLNHWYVPRWRDLGWADVPNEPGVVERTVDGEVVQARVLDVGRDRAQFAYTIQVGYETDRC